MAADDEMEQINDEDAADFIVAVEDLWFAEEEAGEEEADEERLMPPELRSDSDPDDMPPVEYFSDDSDDYVDTTAEQYADGKDIQGIPWDTTPWQRPEYRVKRNADYKTYYNREDEVLAAAPALAAEALKTKEINAEASPWAFYRNWKRVRTSIVHFQLRNLVWPTSAHDVFHVLDNRVMLWNNLTRKDPECVLDATAGEAARAGGIDPVAVCTMCARDGLIAAGGFGGELIVRRLGSKDPVDFSMRVTQSDNGITNAIDIYHAPSGAVRLACSNNDQLVRILDAESFASVAQINLPWAVNCCVAHPGGRLLCAVGDHSEGVLLDPSSGATVARLCGHHDFSFAAAWHPDGNVVATGNQDLTTRLFDLRMPSRALCVLRSAIGAVRSLRFSPDGRTLAVAEPADYVTLYDVAQGCRQCAKIDLFGELAGIGFSPDGQRFFTAVSDMHYSSLLQYNARSGGWPQLEMERENGAD